MAFPTVSTSRRPELTADIRQLSDKLKTTLRFAAEAETKLVCAPSAELPSYAGEAAFDEAVQWTECTRSVNKVNQTRFADMSVDCTYMKSLAEKGRYPKYLYRAHVHGHPFPLPDNRVGDSSKRLGSDFYLKME